MNFQIKKVCCIGAGYVGGPTMAVMAKHCEDLEINVVDMDIAKIRLWNSENLDDLPIYEPGLSEIIKEYRNKNLYFSTNIEKHISEADMIFISVNTPTKKRGIGAGKASDLKWIESCARQIGSYAKGYTIVVERSTLPVKTAETIKAILEAHTVSIKNNKKDYKKFAILSNPEFLAEGTAINNLENPDRVLIGGEEEEAISSLKLIYKNWVMDHKILTTDLWSSELSKLIANAFLAQRISSINSISALCELTDSNITDVSKAIGLDSRIGSEFLNAGPGFGGSCFKKDISNLIYICNHYGLNQVANYWEQVIFINEWQQKRITKIIVQKLYGTISDKKITVLGFAFKPNTNDTRESPAINVCRDLLEEGCFLSIYDPKVKGKQIKNALQNQDIPDKLEPNKFINITTANSIEEAVSDSDAIIILTDWEEFYNLDFEKIHSLMRAPSWLFDARNVIDSREAKLFGFKVWKLGEGK